jgi:hypothetical protein
MATPNIRQKIALLDIGAGTEQLIKDYLQLGYVVHQVINLQPSVNKLLVFYYDPAVDPDPEP